MDADVAGHRDGSPAVRCNNPVNTEVVKQTLVVKQTATTLYFVAAVEKTRVLELFMHGDAPKCIYDLFVLTAQSPQQIVPASLSDSLCTAVCEEKRKKRQRKEKRKEKEVRNRTAHDRCLLEQHCSLFSFAFKISYSWALLALPVPVSTA
jgi:hypothetical protein